MMKKPVSKHSPIARRTSLKFLAEHLGLSPSTISFVLNDAPGRSIPENTRERIRQAAAEFNYRPSMIARTLQGKPTRTVGVLLPELGEGYHSEVLSGIDDLLIAKDYYYFTVHHRHQPKMIHAYPTLLQSHGVDGLIAIDTHLDQPLPLPTVLIAGHTCLPDVTNVVLDHDLAARLALEHLHELGHRRIVYMKGQFFSTDTEQRWQATMKAARELGLGVDERLVVQLEVDSTSPEVGYPVIRKLLKTGGGFTAVLCFNDISAMGCIRALHDAGLRVPEDVSVLGFDDIHAAAFYVPSLTTIRQPLKKMGCVGSEALLRKLARETLPSFIRIEPELIVRESTGVVRRGAADQAGG